MSKTYSVKRIDADEPCERQHVFHNPAAWSALTSRQVDPTIKQFHQQLPDYGATALHSLPDIAEELGFAHVFLKDESTRFGLPSFKIAGASWAIHKALSQHLGLSNGISMAELREALQDHPELRLVTVTEGNWGRATARMAKLLSIRAVVYVPCFMEEYTRNLIREEGAEVYVVEGADYDGSMASAIAESRKPESLLVLDVAFGDFKDIPQWVSDGYTVIMDEADRQIAVQTGGKQADVITCSVGAGGWAQAVVAHYRAKSHPAALCAVEPEAAPSLMESLCSGENIAIKTGHTIMNGMNCGTISTNAWPILHHGIDWAVVVSDSESHAAVKDLQERDINAGPCGAANLAALRKLCEQNAIQDRAEKIVVLFSTEGRREYAGPS